MLPLFWYPEGLELSNANVRWTFACRQLDGGNTLRCISFRKYIGNESLPVYAKRSLATRAWPREGCVTSLFRCTAAQRAATTPQSRCSRDSSPYAGEPFSGGPAFSMENSGKISSFPNTNSTDRAIISPIFLRGGSNGHQRDHHVGHGLRRGAGRS